MEDPTDVIRSAQDSTTEMVDKVMADLTKFTVAQFDKAMADYLLHGAGYLRIGYKGIEHVPFDKVHDQTV